MACFLFHTWSKMCKRHQTICWSHPDSNKRQFGWSLVRKLNFFFQPFVSSWMLMDGPVRLLFTTDDLIESNRLKKKKTPQKYNKEFKMEKMTICLATLVRTKWKRRLDVTRDEQRLPQKTRKKSTILSERLINVLDAPTLLPCILIVCMCVCSNLNRDHTD